MFKKIKRFIKITRLKNFRKAEVKNIPNVIRNNFLRLNLSEMKIYKNN